MGPLVLFFPRESRDLMEEQIGESNPGQLRRQKGGKGTAGYEYAKSIKWTEVTQMGKQINRTGGSPEGTICLVPLLRKLLNCLCL
jgi:hypothetical protein